MKKNQTPPTPEDKYDMSFPEQTNKDYLPIAVTEGIDLLQMKIDHEESLNKQPLYDAYNATSTSNEEGDIEEYQEWLERQLIHRMEPSTNDKTEIAHWKSQSEKWDKLKKEVDACYGDYDDNNEELPSEFEKKHGRESDLFDIGEIAATAFGHLF